MGHCQGLPKKELLQLLWESSWIEIIVSSVKDLTVNGNKRTSASYVVLLVFTPHDLIFYSSCWEEGRERLQYLEVSFIKLLVIFLEGFSSSSLYNLVSAKGIVPARGYLQFSFQGFVSDHILPRLCQAASLKCKHSSASAIKQNYPTLHWKQNLIHLFLS